MLVLTRKLNERIVIGDNVRITGVGIRGNPVRLGIEAPTEVPILRDELHRHKVEEPRAASEGTDLSTPLSYATAVGAGR